jgi:stage V sporulation protein G
VQITEIRIKLMDDRESRNERLLAFCSVTFDHMFVVRDLKIIEGVKGLFVAMPSRKLTDRCGCGSKNHLRARFCNQCGSRLNEDRAPRDDHGRAKLHADVAHPINAGAREFIQGSIVGAYNVELEKAQQPGYVSRYDELDAGEETVGLYESLVGATTGNGSPEYRTHQPHPPRSAPLPRRPVGAPSRIPADKPDFGTGVFEQ